MKRLLTGVAVLVFTAVTFAQNPARVEGRVNAALYGSYQLIQGSTVAGASGQVVNLSQGQCLQSAGTRNFVPISTTVPLKINDTANSANNETVTPSAINVNTTTCQFTATFVNPHSQGAYYITSGTGGLQEAINDNASIGGTLLLDLASTTTNANITSATGGSATLSIEDLRSGYVTSWTWNGSAYGNHLSLPSSAPDISGTGASPLTVTFSKAFSVAPICMAADQSATPAAIQVAPTTTNVVFTGTATHTIAYVCWGVPR